ncbi:MAG: type II toxin-antitoxin system death-on-curing family toxin [Cyanobium sp.]
MRLEQADLRLPTLAEINRAHDRTIEEFGGLGGFKDARLLESAIEATRMKLYYQPEDTLLQVAVGLAYRLIKNHVYTDGNKRTAALAMELTLFHNGYYLDLPPGLLEEWMRMLEASNSTTEASVQEEVASVAETLLRRRFGSPTDMNPTRVRWKDVPANPLSWKAVGRVSSRIWSSRRRFWPF